MKGFAYDCEVNGIYYDLDETNKTAKVTYYSNSDNYSSNSSAYHDTVTIPSTIYRGTQYSVTSIGDHAFYYCSSLTSVEFPSSVTSIGNFAFYNCSGLTSVEIPSSITSIGDYAFSGCSGLISVEIPSSITNIGGCAFWCCSSLTSVEIPSSVTRIEDSTFGYCSSLTSIEIPTSVTRIEGYAFYNCSSLTSVEIPSSVTSIQSNAFEGCSGLKNVKINTKIVGMLFSGFTSIQKITLGEEVTNIDNSAFSGCSGLTSITIPSSVTSIGYAAFSGCSGLTSIIIEDGTESLLFSTNRYYPRAFVDCPIESLYIGRNIIYSDLYSPFADKTTLTSLTIGNNVAGISDWEFSSCSNLTSIEIPNRVTSIGKSAFEGCSSLNSINIPNRVTSIGEYAFYNCESLTSLSIPISVTSIGYSAFNGCSNLESVYSEITNVFSIDAFELSNATLYVPNGMKLTYIQTPGWNVFNDIIEMDPVLQNTSLLLSCNSKGSITINGTTVFTNKIGSVDILEDAENTIVFTPKANCKLEQVCFNGFDITTSVENNTLKAVIPAKSQMVVMFSKQGDLNSDGKIDISDVVSLVNMILGQ